MVDDPLRPLTDPLPLHPESSRIDPARPAIQASPFPLSRDRVELSEDEHDIRAIREAIDQLPEIREDRLQRLRHLLESGTYRVLATQVADRLIQHIIADRSTQNSS